MGDPDSQGEINEELLKQVENIGVQIEYIMQMLDNLRKLEENNSVIYKNLQKITQIQQRHLEIIDEVLFPKQKGENDET